MQVIIKKKEQHFQLKNLISHIRSIQKEIVANDAETAKQRELLVQLEGKVEQAKIRINHSVDNIKTKLEEVVLLKEKKVEAEQKARLLLAPFSIAFEFDNVEGIKTSLGQRFKNYETFTKELNSRELEQRQLDTEQKNLIKVLSEKNDFLKTQEIQLASDKELLQKMEAERIELFGTNDPITERERLNTIIKQARGLVENLQKEVQQKQQDVKLFEDRILKGNADIQKYKETLAQHTRSLIVNLNKQSIDSIEAVEKLFMSTEEAMAVELLQKEASQKISSAKSLLNATEKDLHTAREKRLTEETEGELLPRMEETIAALAELNQQVGKTNKIIEDDEDLKVKHQQVANEIEIQQKEFGRWGKLSSLIGSADGKKFSRFAQGLTLARLTELANRHLIKLSDRYSILKTPEKDLDLQIIDGYQADVVRPMSTLSGGESFLVSLALALGLSDLASRKVQINSLFIDEGFGTLDSDTLDVAISALENLQADGKAIGIISHVDALKERIGTQIQVSKQPGGSSKIKVVSHAYQTVNA